MKDEQEYVECRTSSKKQAHRHLRGLSDIAFYCLDDMANSEQRQEYQLRIDEHFDYLYDVIESSTTRVKWVTRETDPQEVVDLKHQIVVLEGRISANAEIVQVAEKRIFDADKKAREADVQVKNAQLQVESQRELIKTSSSNLSKARERAGELLLRVEELEAEVAELTRKQNVEVGERKLKL